MKKQFDSTWEKFDINGDGFLKPEESHTFMRSLMGKLNKFALAPGSLSDVGGMGPAPSASAEKPSAPAKKPAAAPKKKVEAPKPDADTLAATSAKTDDDPVDPELAKSLDALLGGA